jgi:hypothetical protein
MGPCLAGKGYLKSHPTGMPLSSILTLAGLSTSTTYDQIENFTVNPPKDAY